MARFCYKAINPDGVLIEGELQASDHAAAIEWLQEQGHTPIQARNTGAGDGLSRRVLDRRSPFKRRSPLDVARLTRDLSTLLTAGVQLERSLEILGELADDPATGALISRLLEEIREGASLAVALERQEGVFSRLYVNLVRAGEAGGALESVLDRLAVFMERYEELKASVKSALIYPGILLTVTAASVIVLLVFVVPQFAVLFEDMGQPLPLPTRIVVGAGQNIQDYGWILLLLIAGLYYLGRRQLDKPDVRYHVDRWLLHLPLLGELIVRFEVTVFARTLGTLLASGVPVLNALAIVKETHTNRVLAAAVAHIAEDAAQGKGLAEPMRRTGRFPPLASHLVQVGEETGQLDQTLSRLADIYEKEVSQAIQRALVLVEPILIIGLGVVVGGIIMSILVAVLSVNELAF